MSCHTIDLQQIGWQFFRPFYGRGGVQVQLEFMLRDELAGSLSLVITVAPVFDERDIGKCARACYIVYDCHR